MSTSILERTRQAHEDIELFERATVEACIDEPKTHKDNVVQSHWVNVFVEKIMDRSKQLVDIYQDEDGSRKSEIQAMAGKGPQLFANFYDQLRNVKDYHRKFPNLEADRPEAEQMLNNFDLEKVVSFSGEEAYGKYMDLHTFFERYINLNKVNKNLDYMYYLSIFYTFPDRSVVKDKLYIDYITDLLNYLISLFRRTNPLLDVEQTLSQVDKEIEESWNSGTLVPINYNDEDRENEQDPLWCKYTRKLHKNQAAKESFEKGKKYKTVVKNHKIIVSTEIKINRLVTNFLNDQVDNTKLNIERKQARGYDNNDEEDDNSDVESSSDDEEEVRMTKENYPVGWDGNPIPYWLYKLHGLGIEYKCEICGNMSYWGRRAFERHFQEWRHAHGMKCLRLENTKEFHEITKIQDALELAKKLKELKEKGKWDDLTMEEYEDPEGNVMNKKTFLDLRAQGLV
eukprot:TRINITY_DN72_c0_g2_i1.p1 TRINITY_DN72_c0_g2~~TRINITY_DN72_c0_g2_i1.p1  ORF type:complete len:473 (-),score=112.21 TRINITY_DN72_c0_g2_i1:35-1399(-)